MKLNWLAEPELSPLFNVLFYFHLGRLPSKWTKIFGLSSIQAKPNSSITNRTQLHQTKLIHTKPNSTIPNQTHPCQTELNYTKLNSSIPNRTQPHQTKLIHTKPNSTTPNQTHPNQTKQSQTIPNPNWLGMHGKTISSSGLLLAILSTLVILENCELVSDICLSRASRAELS